MKFNETKSQERLINLMLQAGVEWPSPLCTHAAQDADGKVWTYFSKPLYINGYWSSSIGANSCICSLEKLPNYHQTIITREQYEAREGWITWHGGECPVGNDVKVEVMLRRGGDQGASLGCSWAWGQEQTNKITAYRIHKEQPNARDGDHAPPAEPCESVKACIPDQPTIEQLIAEYRDRVKEQEVEHAKLQAQGEVHAESIRRMSEAGDAVRAAIAKAGWGAETIKISENKEQPVITDWRYLRVGDEITVAGAYEEDGVGVVASIDNNDTNQPIQVNFSSGESNWPSDISKGGWKFIRRP